MHTTARLRLSGDGADGAVVEPGLRFFPARQTDGRGAGDRQRPTGDVYVTVLSVESDGYGARGAARGQPVGRLDLGRRRADRRSAACWASGCRATRAPPDGGRGPAERAEPPDDPPAGDVRAVGLVVVALVVVGLAVAAARGTFAGPPADAPDPLVDQPAPAGQRTARWTAAGSSRRRVAGGVTDRQHLGLVVRAVPGRAARHRRLRPRRRAAGPGLTIDTRDGPVAARSLLHEVDATDLPVVQDPDGRLAVDWGATGIPETFVVDATGTVRARSRGAVTLEWLQEQARQWGSR